MCFLSFATIGHVIVSDGHKTARFRAFCCRELMYHIEMTAHIYNIWSLAHRTHSPVLVSIVMICFVAYVMHLCGLCDCYDLFYGCM